MRGLFFWGTLTLDNTLLGKAVTLAFSQVRQAGWELPAQIGHVILGIDEGYARFQTRAIVLHTLFPGFPGLGLLQALPNPRHSGLVQHEFLQLPWLYGRVFA